jgi:uncharacterized membrane protein
MKKSYAISDRMPVDEIQELIEEGNHLTFDFLALISIASLIAGAGLVGDNVVFVIASMLVSPLMGPILSTTFGLAITNYDIVYRGLRNEAWGVFISMLTGFLLGVFSSFVYNPEFHSHEMVGEISLFSALLLLLLLLTYYCTAVFL